MDVKTTGGGERRKPNERNGLLKAEWPRHRILILPSPRMSEWF
ncbi:MAG: hypothetical protein AABW68_00215 [archaeon]